MKVPRGGSLSSRLMLTLLASSALATGGVASRAGAVSAGLPQGSLNLGVHGVQHTFDAMRVDEVRPTQHSDFGGRVEIAYAALPWLEVGVSAYRGASHFDFDTAFERGNGRDWDWSVDVGASLLITSTDRLQVLIGGTVLYGEAQSSTVVSYQGPTGGSITLDGPRTYMVGGTGKLMATLALVDRLHGVLQVNSGVVQARGHALASGDLYNWNGRTLSVALGLRYALLRGRR